ncbi:MAG TPA: isoprenylcysteine carboxylmethyltransferase family protein, partial [Terriglobales bacterium]
AVEDAMTPNSATQERKSVPSTSGVNTTPATEEHSVSSAIAALAVGACFLGFWFWLLPHWFGFSINLEGAARLRLLAAVPSILGFAVALRCVWDFGWTGHGTPAPIAPPKNLVVVGMYRYVRNPMYLGFYFGWLGLWIMFGHAHFGLILAVCAVVLCVDLFVRFYEEPKLKSLFGAEYEEYCRNVPRWLPRLRPWKK